MIDLKQVGKRATWVPMILLTGMLFGCGTSRGPDVPSPLPPPPTTPPTTQTTVESGRLIDSTVTNVSFVSGMSDGVTDMDGRFDFELIDGVPQGVTFSFAGIDIGSSIGNSILTPLDLVQDSDIDSQEVLNITRFLQMLDSDGDPSNGIVPSADLIAAVESQNFLQIDFADPDFDNQVALTTLISFINSVNAEEHELPSIPIAQDHLRSSLACLSSGVFSGRFEGEDSGHYVLLMQHQRAEPSQFGDDLPRPGVGSALIYSESQDRLIGVVPQQALGFDSDKSFIVGVATNGAEFAGSLLGFEQIVDGQWRNDVEGGSGTFSGLRVAGDSSAVYRLAGGFGDNTPFDLFDDTPDNSGGVALDILADNTVVGTVISARGEQYMVLGTLAGNTINASSPDGVIVNVTFDSTGSDPDNEAVGLFGVPGFWGTWQLGNVSGGLAGTSCRLN